MSQFYMQYNTKHLINSTQTKLMNISSFVRSQVCHIMTKKTPVKSYYSKLNTFTHQYCNYPGTACSQLAHTGLIIRLCEDGIMVVYIHQWNSNNCWRVQMKSCEQVLSNQLHIKTWNDYQQIVFQFNVYLSYSNGLTKSSFWNSVSCQLYTPVYLVPSSLFLV